MENTSVVQRLRQLRRQSQPATRRVLPFLAALFLATPLGGLLPSSAASPSLLINKVPPPSAPGHVAGFDAQLRARYAALGAEQQGLRFAVFEQALTGFLNLRRQGKVPAEQQRLAVIDFDLPSSE